MDTGVGTRDSGGVFGRYVLVERLGGREPSQRWVALDLELDRKLVLELRPVGDAQGQALLDKAANMARINHPNVVTIHDVGQAEGQLYIAREHVEGEVLVGWLGAGPYPWQETMAVLGQVGEAIAAIHEAGLVHRAVRPTKIVIEPRGRACLLDLGLRATASDETGPASRALELEASREDERVLRVRPSRGTSKPPARSPVYRAPELLRGEPGDARSDLFSFCVLVFEALYGVPPFEGSSAEVLLEAIESGRRVELPADERAPGWIHKTIVRGLALDPDERPADMRALLDALTRSPAGERTRRAVRVGFGLGGVALAALAFSLWPKHQDPCAEAGNAIYERFEPAELRLELEPRAAALGSEGLELLLAGLDRYALAWADTDRQLCRDHATKRTTPGLHAVRSECLARGQVTLEALARLDWAPPQLADALIEHPHAALRSLGDPHHCLGRSADEAGKDRPVLPAEAKARAELRLLLELQPPGAAKAAQARLATLDAKGDAELQLFRARAAVLAGNPDQARLHFDRAAQLAVIDEPLIAAQAWIELGTLELDQAQATPGSLEARSREILQLFDYAEVLVGESSGPALLELAQARAKLALATGRPERAQPLLDRALASPAVERDLHPDLVANLRELRAALVPQP